MKIYSKGGSLLKLKKGTVISPGCQVLRGDRYEKVQKWSVIAEVGGEILLVERK